MQQHVPSSFAYFIKCRFNEELDCFRTFRGPLCAEEFVKELINNLRELYETHLIGKFKKVEMSEDDQVAFTLAERCHICKKRFADLSSVPPQKRRGHNQAKIIEHCHLTGKYRGAAHNVCNKNFFVPRTVPVFLHNFSKYDCHLLIRELHRFESNDSNMEVIPNTNETYTAVNKIVKIASRMGQKQKYLKISFRDSFRFLASSIDKLSKNLNPGDFKNLHKVMVNHLQSLIPEISEVEMNDRISMMKRKGVFPYETMKDFNDFLRESLPPKESFASCLDLYQPISDKDYQFAQTVYEKFTCRNLGDYSDLYLMTDVLILADIFETFRNECLDESLYGLDPANYFTSPGLAWDAMLKITRVKLDIITDMEKSRFIQEGIRGGLVQVSLRHVVAENKYTTTEPVEDPSYLLYLDVNNLYGYSMIQKLPETDFQWCNEEEVN